ncbi:MAG: hypothetical protein QOH88_3507 [Verrucomicrobiota bacterium]|jgi:hypothetical protein
MKHVARLALGLLGACIFSSEAFGQYQATWVLRKIEVSNRLNSFSKITREKYDAQGGSVEITVDGRGLDLCPGGREILRFNWRFPQDISRVSSVASVNFEAGIVTVNSPCNGGIAGLSSIYITGSSGVTAALPEDRMRSVDLDRFYRVNDGDTRANPTKTGSGSVGLNTKEAFRPDRPLAYFVIWIHMRTGGEVAYVYEYDRGTAPPGPIGPTGPTGPTGPSDTTKACGYSLGSGIYNLWMRLGGERSVLGCAKKEEAEAGRSPNGTTGRYALFNDGVIIWHRNGKHASTAFEVHGCIGGLYQSLGGTGSWLGFPISNEYSVSGGRRSDFENGYVFWNAQTRQCQALKY